MPVFIDESTPPSRMADGFGLPVTLVPPHYATDSPVLDTSIYAAGDALHIAPLLKFEGLFRDPLYSATILGLVVEDSTATPQNAAGELWLFDRRQIVLPALNAAWTLAAQDREAHVCVVPFGVYYTSTATGKSEAWRLGIPIRNVRHDSALYGVAVTKGTPTYGVGSLKFTLVTQPD